MIALIPARAGSQRCPGKNMRLLQGHPLTAYTIAAAQQSQIFDRIIVCSDDEAVLSLAAEMDESWYRRKRVSALQPDIEWVSQVLAMQSTRPDCFAILRPTSPFRTAATIKRAFALLIECAECADSIRAVEPVTQTPYKMWTWDGPGMPIRPLLSGALPDGTPYHSAPTQACPQVYVQTSSLEMSWTANVEQHRTISGRKLAPFFTEGLEGFSIDTEADWERATRLARESPTLLPPVPLARVS